MAEALKGVVAAPVNKPSPGPYPPLQPDVDIIRDNLDVNGHCLYWVYLIALNEGAPIRPPK